MWSTIWTRDNSVEIPVLVKRGAAGTTTLAENVEALPKPSATGWRSISSPTPPTSTEIASTTSPNSTTWGA